jgi:haloalkane dehalogenase
MAVTELKDTGILVYRDAVPPGTESGDPVLLVHGFPESSRMWEPLMAALSEAGRRCVAPDLFGLGDSEDPGPATYERNVEALTALHQELGLGRVALVVHDWGGFIGLTWAATHPELLSALVISDTGFFSDGKWHGPAQAMRSEQGEALIGALDRDGFAGLLRADGAPFSDEDVDAYWRPFAEGRGREATLEFYRSMDFEKLAPYEPKLYELEVPTLILWGAEDKFAPIGGAHRFRKRIAGSELVAIEGAGHFVFEQARGATTAAVVEFLARTATGRAPTEARSDPGSDPASR